MAAQVGGTSLWGGGDTVTWMENALLFLVICVTKVLIDDSRDVFLALPWDSQLSGGGFHNDSPLLEPLSLALSPVLHKHTSYTDVLFHLEPPDGCCPHICIGKQ